MGRVGRFWGVSLFPLPLFPGPMKEGVLVVVVVGRDVDDGDVNVDLWLKGRVGRCWLRGGFKLVWLAEWGYTHGWREGEGEVRCGRGRAHGI